MAEQQMDAYEFTISIVLVKMNVKFPCKMKLQLNGTPLTSQVPSNESHKFIFNQQIILKEDGQKSYFELQVSLLTEKGGKYIAGVLRIQNSDIRSQGQSLTIPLIKCLDSEAYCELRVDQVQASRVSKKQSVIKSQINRKYTPRNQIPRQSSPPNDKIRQRMVTQNQQYIGGQTKSQLHFPLTSKKPKQDWQDNRTKLNVAQSIYNRNPSRSPGKMFEQHGRIEQMNAMVERDKLIQAQVYKEGYNKLKQKYKKQAQIAKTQLNKRIGLQNSQNNLKLEIMRLKLRTEEQQKNINEKNHKIKQMQAIINNFQKKQLDLVYLKQEYSNKDHTLRMFEQTVRNLTRDLEQLRTQSNEKTLRDTQKIKQLKKQLDNLKQKAQNKQAQLDKQLKNKIQALRIKQSQLYSKNEMLNRQKKAVDDLQRQAQTKVIQYERTIQTERAMGKAKAQQLKARLDKSEKDRHQIELQKTILIEDLQKTKALLTKLEYENKILIQQTDVQKKQLLEMRQYKQKHSELIRQIKMTTDDRNHIQKQLQRALQNKEINLTQLSKQHQQQIQYFKKLNKELDQKHKSSVNKILQLQGLLQASKVVQQKSKRAYQSLNNELNDLKEKQKSLKKALKGKDQQIIALENEFSTTKQKNKSNQNFMKHQIQQHKQQLERIRIQYQDQSMKNAMLTQTNAQLSIQLGKTKVKLQFMQEKTEKDIGIINEKKQQIQNLLKDHEIQVSSLNETINSLRQTQKDLTNKMQKQQIETLRTQDRLDRATRQLKVLEEKLLSVQGNFKQKQLENTNIIIIKTELQTRVNDLQQELTSAKNDQSQLQAQKVKNLKVIQIIQQQNSKWKKENQSLKHAIQDKQKQIEQLNGQIKRNKEEITKLQIKLNTISNDFLRFRQYTIDSLNTSFSPVLTDAKKYLGSAFNIDIIIPRKNIEPTTSQINQLIVSFSKDTKLAVNKLGQHSKQLQRQNQRITDELTGNINKGQTVEYDLNRQIQELQEQLTQAYTHRDQQNLNFDVKLKQLNGKIRQKDRQINSLNQQVQQLNFSLNTMKLDFEAQSDENLKKNTQIKRNIQDLEERIKFLTATNTNLQEKIFNLQTQKQSILGQIRDQKENNSKLSKTLNQTSQKNIHLQKINEESKKHKKDLLEKISDLQIQLNNEKDSHDKTRKLLEEEEVKGSQLKLFVSNLMKQKQQIIKSQLEKGEQIIKFESNILQINQQKYGLTQELERVKKLNQDLKEINKKTVNNLRDIQLRLSEEKIKSQKLNEKIKEKEKQILNKDETLETLQVKYSKLSERNIKQLNQLREQVQAKTNEIVQLTQIHSQKCFKYQKEKTNLQNTITNQQSQLISLQQQIYTMKQSGQGNTNKIQLLENQKQQLKVQVHELTIEVENLNQELKEKEEITYQLQGKIYGLQIRVQAKENEKIQKVNMVDEDWICKYEEMCQQYQQRIELIQKERENFKLRLHDQEQRYKKLNSEKSNLQIEDSKLKSILEEKIKKLEQERLHIVTQKNSQIQKMTEELKSNTDLLKSKDLQSRRVLHELQVARNTITKMDAKVKQNEDKMKSLNKVYQAEIQQFKKKQIIYQKFKENVSTMQWSAQREVRKVLQAFIKKSLQSCQDSKNSQKMMDIVRNLEQSVVDSMKFNLDDIK